jgi:hypothetical protein
MLLTVNHACLPSSGSSGSSGSSIGSRRPTGVVAWQCFNISQTALQAGVTSLLGYTLGHSTCLMAPLLLLLL